jgi:hypothetical protein
MRLEKYLVESLQRYCHIYKAKNKKWYVELADREHGGRMDSTTYGPFNSFDEADDELNYHSNPGGLTIDKSGKKPVPKKSPNNRPIQKPSKQNRRGFYF